MLKLLAFPSTNVEEITTAEVEAAAEAITADVEAVGAEAITDRTMTEVMDNNVTEISAINATEGEMVTGSSAVMEEATIEAVDIEVVVADTEVLIGTLVMVSLSLVGVQITPGGTGSNKRTERKCRLRGQATGDGGCHDNATGPRCCGCGVGVKLRNSVRHLV